MMNICTKIRTEEEVGIKSQRAEEEEEEEGYSEDSRDYLCQISSTEGSLKGKEAIRQKSHNILCWPGWVID
jgi:hypothetical protein